MLDANVVAGHPVDWDSLDMNMKRSRSIGADKFLTNKEKNGVEVDVKSPEKGVGLPDIDGGSPPTATCS